MIEFQNVSYTYNKGSGVTNLNFSIEDGDFVFLIGSTGSGKTTLMRLIYFDLIPNARLPRLTVSIAYSTWYNLPSGENTVIARSYPVSYTHLTLPTKA